MDDDTAPEMGSTTNSVTPGFGWLLAVLYVAAAVTIEKQSGGGESMKRNNAVGGEEDSYEDRLNRVLVEKSKM